MKTRNAIEAYKKVAKTVKARQDWSSKICTCGNIMREVKSSIGSYWICDHCGEMKN